MEQVLAAFNAGDPPAMRACLVHDAVASVTGSDGAALAVHGADGYVAAIEAMDLPSARYSVTLTQAPVVVGTGLVLVAVDMRDHRGGRDLHNSPRTWPMARTTGGSPGSGWWRRNRLRANFSGVDVFAEPLTATCWPA